MGNVNLLTETPPSGLQRGCWFSNPDEIQLQATSRSESAPRSARVCYPEKEFEEIACCDLVSRKYFGTEKNCFDERFFPAPPIQENGVTCIESGMLT
ncbi:hypothetical protein CDAR_121411 [Caerostris darwini]|uniref:Uncharacterized protein n=1 Tax=Caerostris darwini TaxID=1538125 RepID=A0AAV4MC42_9ARAC|nr:hypothetical protein CDAR_121411 [Caerostris darwini]